MACEEFDIDTIAIEKNIKKGVDYQKNNPSCMGGVPIATVIG